MTHIRYEAKKLVLTNLAQFLWKPKRKRKGKNNKHLEVKPCLSHAQAKLCSKHNARTGPTAVWAGLIKRGTREAFEHFSLYRILFLVLSLHLDFFQPREQTCPLWSVRSICRKRKCTVMWLQKSHLWTGRSYSKKKKKYNKEGTTKKIMIYQCKRKTTKGHHVIENLGSYFHTFLSNYLLHFRRFFLFNERTFLMTLCSNRTVSCHIRDWFLTKYKVADRHLETR